MDGIRCFIISLCAVSAASSVMNSVIGDGAMKKYINYFMSLVLVLFFISPIKDIIAALPGTVADISEKYESVGGAPPGSSMNVSYIGNSICEKFSLTNGEVYCSLYGNTISIRIKKKPGIVADDIKIFVEERYGLSAEVVLYE